MTVVTASQLAGDALEFLRFKRVMGIPYWRAEFVLDEFVRFVRQHWGDHGEVGSTTR
jgi:integrase/recombinase XerD